MITKEDIEREVPLNSREALDRWWLIWIPSLDFAPIEYWTVYGPEALMAYVKTYQDPSFT